ncbi:calcium-activated potassium channel subunit alpha-1 [Thraustotheca clavata]|uniref:Calcium-activated potassium channel subunit alpha-1 n=1 Tax=Thraustotheca clavata TaxID=74557 RepID=A0A1V9ZQD2_9STRA|nr:calcium-activated potassium channel subunit alpha-1 [Thraustotheca clavata]
MSRPNPLLQRKSSLPAVDAPIMRKRKLEATTSRRQSIQRIVSVTVANRIEQIRDPRARGIFFLFRDSGESIRDYTLRTLEQSNAGSSLDCSMILLSLLWVGIFISVNRDGPRPLLDINTQADAIYLGYVLGVIFLVDYMLRLYAAPLRANHFWSFFSMVDFVSFVPMVVELALGNDTLSRWAEDPTRRQIVSFLQVTKTVRILRTYRILKYIKSTVTRQITATVLTVICIIIAMAGILQILDQCATQCPTVCQTIMVQVCMDATAPRAADTMECLELNSQYYCCTCQNLGFFDWVYFVVVSISTLGYGDIAPRSRFGRLATSLMIMLTFVLVPIQVNKLIATISSHSGYTNSYKEYRTHTHGIITAGGEVSAGSLNNFLRQFFHPDNPNWNEKIVILHPSAPTNEVKKIVHMYEPRVQYIVGSAMNELDLERAMISRASICYVMINKHSHRSSNEDQSSTLLTAAFRGSNSKIPIYSQVYSSLNIGHCTLSGASGVVCIEKLKLGVVGLNCSIMGLSTLLSNLLDTVSPNVESLYPSGSWEAAYLRGYIHEIYKVDLPRTFSGLTYGELILFLFGTIQVIPLAMLTDQGARIMPMDFKLGTTADPTICCTLYVLASSISVADRISEYPLEQIREFRQTLRKQERYMAERAVNRQRTEVAIPPPQHRETAFKPKLSTDDSDGATQSTVAEEPLEKGSKYGGDVNVFQALAKSIHGVKHAFEKTTPYKDFLDKPLPDMLEGHVVVVGLPLSLHDLINPLRQHALDSTNIQPIVFIAPFGMTEAHFQTLPDTEAVYFFQGSPLSSFDLERIHIDSASAIIILASTTNKRRYVDENMVDADAITTVRYIIEACGSATPNLIVELVKATNVKFMSFVVKRPPRRGRRQSDGRHLRSFGSTSLKYSSTNSPELMKNMEQKIDIEHICEPSYASGRVYVSGMIDSLMSECYQKPNIIAVVNLLMFGSPEDEDCQRLFQVKVPASLVGKEFSECFRKCLKLSLICIGCLHISTETTPSYVHTNPSTTMKITANDLLYLIGKPCAELPL